MNAAEKDCQAIKELGTLIGLKYDGKSTTKHCWKNIPYANALIVGEDFDAFNWVPHSVQSFDYLMQQGLIKPSSIDDFNNLLGIVRHV